MARIKRFDYQFPGQRKPDNFIVYPESTSEYWYLIQGDRSIARMDKVALRDGRGIGTLSIKGSDTHALALTGKPAIFSSDFVELVKAHVPGSGDEIGPGVYVA